MPVDPELMKLLVCPKCHGKLEETRTPKGGEGLKCGACKLLYEVEDDIPKMLIDEAIKL